MSAENVELVERMMVYGVRDGSIVSLTLYPYPVDAPGT